MVSLFLQHKTLEIQPIIILNIRIENKCLPTNRNKRYTNTVNVQTNKQIAFCFELIQRQMQNSFRFQWVFFFCIQISWVPSVEVKENNECLVWSFQHRTALKYILFWQKKKLSECEYQWDNTHKNSSSPCDKRSKRLKKNISFR